MPGYSSSVRRPCVVTSANPCPCRPLLSAPCLWSPTCGSVQCPSGHISHVFLLLSSSYGLSPGTRSSAQNCFNLITAFVPMYESLCYTLSPFTCLLYFDYLHVLSSPFTGRSQLTPSFFSLLRFSSPYSPFFVTIFSVFRFHIVRF